MKASLSSGALLALALPAVLATPLELVKRDCNANNCLRALRGATRLADPQFPSAFCFSYISRIVTATETSTDYTTETTTSTETVATITNYEATVTQTVLPPVDTLKKRRDTLSPEELSASIVSQCSYDPTKISSDCSCFLGTATSTVTESTTATLPVTVTATATDTLTVDIPTLTITETCFPTATAAITNGGFGTGSLSPWYSVPVGSSFKQGTASVSYNPLSIHHKHAFKAGVSVAFNKAGKVKLAQDLVTCPGATYSLDFDYFFFGLRFGDASIVVTVDGVELFNIDGNPATLQYESPTAQTFTATSGSTYLEFEFNVKKGVSSEDIFIDAVSVTPV
jgi:hypothetical protein